MSELIDIYDDNVELLGTKDRDAVHADGDWHKAFHCWIVSGRDDGQFVLFQLRGAEKKVYPDTLDITAAGHLTHGETAEDGLRELEEELGVTVDFDKLVPLGLRTEVVKLDGITNREFDETFLLRDDRPLTSYVLQEDEVTGMVEIRVEDGLRLFSGEVDSVEVHSIRLTDHGTEEGTRRVTADDVIPRTDRYYLKVFIMAERYFAGSSYLAI